VAWVFVRNATSHRTRRGSSAHLLSPVNCIKYGKIALQPHLCICPSGSDGTGCGPGYSVATDDDRAGWNSISLARDFVSAKLCSSDDRNRWAYTRLGGKPTAAVEEESFEGFSKRPVLCCRPARRTVPRNVVLFPVVSKQWTLLAFCRTLSGVLHCIKLYGEQ